MVRRVALPSIVGPRLILSTDNTFSGKIRPMSVALMSLKRLRGYFIFFALFFARF